jgi:hypothetical protein
VVHVRSVDGAADSDAARSVFLLEAYVPAAATDGDPVGEVLAAIRATPDVRLVGTVVIPRDETMLCLIEAAADDAEMLVARIGRDAIRVVEVTWVPDPGT